MATCLQNPVKIAPITIVIVYKPNLENTPSVRINENAGTQMIKKVKINSDERINQKRQQYVFIHVS